MKYTKSTTYAFFAATIFHIGILCLGFCFYKPMIIASTPKQKILVHTKTYIPPKQTVATQSIKPKKKQKNKKSTSAKKQTKQKNLFAELDKNLAKLEHLQKNKSPSSNNNLHIPTVPKTLSLTAHSEQKSFDFNAFSDILKRALILPEYGDVRLLLTIESSGEVSEIEVLSANSEKNRLYLLEALRKVKLVGVFEKQTNITITFRRE